MARIRSLRGKAREAVAGAPLGWSGHGKKQREGREGKKSGDGETRVSPSSSCCFLPLDQSKEQTHAGAERIRRYKRWGQASGAWFPSFLSQRQVQDDAVGGLAGARIHQQAADHGAGFPLTPFLGSTCPLPPPGGRHSEARASRDIHAF